LRTRRSSMERVWDRPPAGCRLTRACS
jgi:hypothetical protein